MRESKLTEKDQLEIRRETRRRLKKRAPWLALAYLLIVVPFIAGIILRESYSWAGWVPGLIGGIGTGYMSADLAILLSERWERRKTR